MLCLVSGAVISVGASKPEWHLYDNTEENICRALHCGSTSHRLTIRRDEKVIAPFKKSTITEVIGNGK